MNLFRIGTSGSGEDVFQGYFLSRVLAAPLFIGVEPFVQFC